MRTTRLLTIPAALVAALIASPSAHASPESVPVPTAKVECVSFNTSTSRCEVLGVVYAMAQIGERTYIGGRFTTVAGQPRANVAAIRGDGSLDPDWNPTTNGTVYALAAAADGSKVFLGGTFTTVAGVNRGRLAAVTPDTGQPVASWRANANNNAVRALVADGGDRLYVGGSFGRVAGQVRPRLAAVSQETAAVDTGFVPAPSGTVRTLALSDDGQELYAGGGFTTIGGKARPGAAELDPATGSATSFAPSDGGVVISMDVSPDGRIFFGTTSNRTWAYDPAAGGTPAYRVRTGGDVQAILATDDEVYIGGHFDTMPEAKVNRLALASFDPDDGSVTAWNPGANGPFGVWALGLTRTVLSPGAAPALSAGGDFTRVGGVARRGYARFRFAG